MKILYKIIFTTIVVMTTVVLHAQTIVYVNGSASGINNGTSWVNAYTSLQAGIDAAALSTPAQVWVKAGTYFPTTGTDRTISFTMKNDVEIYGGFAGTETLLSQRDWIANETILSGDIGVLGDKNDNSNNVINNDYLSTAPLTASAILDGVIVEGGYAVSTGTTSVNGGGGIRNTNASPIIRNCTIRNNENAGGFGGGMFNTGESNPIILGCVFYENTSLSWGGAIAFRPESNISFVHNVASTIANCLFYDNTSGSVGGAIYVANYLVNIINNTVTENTSNNSGGAGIVYLEFGVAVNDAAYTNNIVWGNIAINSGQGQEQIRLNNPGPVFTANIVEGGVTGVSSLNIDPVFTDALNDDFSISYCNSPAIDIGSSSNIPAFLTTDLTGNNRVFGSAIDLGAYEVQSLRPSFSTNNVTHVSCFGQNNGQVTLNATGTHGPLTFSLNGTNYFANNVFTSLTAGSYTAYAKDNKGCIVTEPITINQPAQLGATVNVTDVSCFGEAQGIIGGEFGGGTPPWRISFDGGSSFVTPQLTGGYSITGLVAGTYNVTIVDANSCSFTIATPAVISSPTEIVATVTKSDITCNGAADGAITINATGGTGILQYSIDGSTFQTSNSFSGLVVASYSIKVKDANNCELTLGTETITEPAVLSTSVSKTDLICSGSQA
ncbi:MAG: choice-of-anchor Q domain-containing protein, partial [Cyclobacteriaceae bacterium]